jgi:hypothetical protein
MKFLQKIKSGLSILSILLMMLGAPLLSFADVYRYDVNARLINLQSSYPGGIDGLYFFCNDKLTAKLNYLQSLGITFSGTELADEKYQFLGSCIYGAESFRLATCGVGSGQGCEPVKLPLDLPTLERLSQANTTSPSANSAANFY